MLPTSRVKQHASAVGRDVEVLVRRRAVEQQRVGAVLALDGVAAVARVPLEDVVAGAEQGDVVALVAVDEVVAVAAEQEHRRRCCRGCVSLPAPPSTVMPISAARLPVALKLSSPPFMLRTRFSVVPMSMLNGAGSTRSKRTRVPLAVAVKTSAPLPPLTSTVSVPSPPSFRSVSSPGFQIMRSSPGLAERPGRRRRRRSACRCRRRRAGGRRPGCRGGCRRPHRHRGSASRPRPAGSWR